MSVQEERSVTVGMAEPTVVAGRYVLGDRLGSGGMAQVFRAHDDVLGRDVAVKVFGPSVDPHGPDRIRSEMRTHAVLSHPALVTVHDAGTDEPPDGPPRAYLVMELIDGPALSQLLAQGPLPPERVTEIGVGVADALAYVHSRDVVHRDVKPANILIDPAGQPHLADFGIAQTLGEAGHTLTGFTVGTAPYLSPEQVLGQPVTSAADIYALGLVLLEALTGRREYPGLNAETALARLSRPPNIDAGLPHPWPGLLARMTDLDPGARPRAAEIASILRHESPGGSESPGPVGTEGVASHPTALSPTPTRLIPDYAAPTEVHQRDSRRLGMDSRPGWATEVLRRSGRHPLAIAAAGVGVILILIVAFSGTSTRQPAKPASSVSPSSPPAPTQLNSDLARLRQLVTS